MTVQSDEGRCLLAKAQQLKECALSTADRTRRKQFLLIATEYQKLAYRENADISVGHPRRLNNGASEFGAVTKLRLAPQPTTAANSNVPVRSLSQLWHLLRRVEIVDVTIWAILALISFALLLVPGDQTAQGLKAVLDFFIR